MNNDDYHKSIQHYRDELRSQKGTSRGQSVSRNDLSEEQALARLSNTDTVSQERLGALLWLKAQALSSKSFAKWRPLFLDGLRSASDSDDKKLRELAIETLINYGDKETQQRILDGLNNPSEAVISNEFALRLLSQDPHTAALEAARLYADDSDEATRLEALRVLANDAGSVEKFANLLFDSNQPESVRVISATALSSLDRARLDTVAASMTSGSRGAQAKTDSDVDKHVRALLELQK